MSASSGPAYRVETARLSLRCLEPAHLELLSRAVHESLAHLRPWMGWALHEPVSPQERVDRLRACRGHFDLGSDYSYGLFDKQVSRLLGVATLKLSTVVDERELGYWLHPEHTGQGLMHEAGLALLRVAFSLEALDAVEVRVDPENERSARVAERLGFSGPVLDPLSISTPQGDKKDAHVYTMARVQYATSEARRSTLQAFDVLDRRIL